MIELLLVLVILAVLASVVVPLYFNRVDEAREKATRAELSHLQTVLATFELDNNRFPTTDEGLGALLQRRRTLPEAGAAPTSIAIPLTSGATSIAILSPGRTG